MHFEEIPSDIVLIIMQYLSAFDLAAMARTCRLLHHLVEEFGWAIHVRYNPRLSYSLHKSFRLWDPRWQVRYHTLSDRNWAHAAFIARPLSRKWPGKLQPVLALNSSRLLVGAGNTIYSYAFTAVKPRRSPGIIQEGSFITCDRLQAARDITSMTSVPDGRHDRTVFVGYANGILERLTLPECNAGAENVPIESSLREQYHYHAGEIIESLSSSGELLISLSINGTAALLNHASSSPTPQLLDLNSRGWATHISTRGSSPYAAFGTSSVDPLVVHSIQASHLSEHPFAILSSGLEDEYRKPSAVYGIAVAPPSSPWGASDQIIVSGWYDGQVRVHDLRSPDHLHRANKQGRSVAPLKPVLEMYDPWTFEPNYCVSCGGGSSSYITAGTARHSVVALWDVRNPQSGWSVHAPGNDSSPVYSIILENSKLFGVTQSRPFVLDFGPDAKEETYPSLKFHHRDENLKKPDRHGIGFYVTKYSHGRQET